MKSDYLYLIDLWKKEVVIRQLKEELAVLKNAVEKRVARIKDLIARHQLRREEEGKLEQELNRVDEESQKTEKKILSLDRAASQGSIGNYELFQQERLEAVRRTEQLEEEYLQLVEKQEELVEEIKMLTLRIRSQKELLQEDKELWNTIGGQKKQRIYDLLDQQKEIFVFMNDRVVKEYNNLAGFHLQVLSRVIDDSCQHCNISVPLLLRAKVDRGLVQQCSSCRAFLIGEYEDCP